MTDPKARILVVDDDRAFRVSTAALLRADGHDVEIAANGTDAVHDLRGSKFDLMLLDLRMPGLDGISVVEALRTWGEGMPILMVSGYGTVDAAVRALHVGVDDFLTKPVEPELLTARVAELLERRPSVTAHGSEFCGIVGRAPVIRELIASIRMVAPTRTTVLIEGETGTGKELVAAALHRLSDRAGGPFLAMNCGALADGLLESELFGHMRGAFTGAIRDRMGLLEAASGGTLFLDEIGEISLALQQRLLRVLQEREVMRVGSVRSVPIDVRIIAASNRDLRALVASGAFREDLFYRLSVFPLTVPPLRDRRSDIPLLVLHALSRLHGDRTVGSLMRCSPFAMRLLRAHHWPGNVRELFAAIESACIRSNTGRIEAQHLPPDVRATADARAATARYQAGSGENAEREAIVAALDETDGVLSRSASLLGMGRTTLWRKLKAYGIATNRAESMESEVGDE